MVVAPPTDSNLLRVVSWHEFALKGYGPIHCGRLFSQLWVRGRSVPCVSSEMMVNTASVSVGQGPMGLSRLTVNMNVFPNLFLKRRPAWSARALIFAMDW